MKVYAVKIGRNTGIYTDWESCKEQVDGYSGASYKSFKTEQDARLFLEEKSEKMPENKNSFKFVKPAKNLNGETLIAYVDGSCLGSRAYSYGCVLLDEHRCILEELNGVGQNANLLSMNNVAGELLGTMTAVNYAIAHNYSYIDIYYDYEGIEKWATGEWKAKKEGTKQYVLFMNEKKERLPMRFCKVMAHTGDEYNERADKLAKEALGIKKR